MPLLLLVSLLLQAPAVQPPPAKPIDLNAAMMDATFRLVGISHKSTPAKPLFETGTAFLCSRPVPGKPALNYYVLVTAAHVLRNISGDYAIAVLRLNDGAGRFKRAEHRIQIRRSGKDLWVEHGAADVAAMYVDLPDQVAAKPLDDSVLAGDSDFEKYEIRPGDNVFAVGYPYGFEANKFGFPVLRSGLIASYPLIPSSDITTFLVDFNVFGGNSGGPVYINQLGRLYGGEYKLDTRVFRVLGLVSEQHEVTSTGERLGVAVIVPAQFIKDTVAKLPSHPGGG